MKVTKTVCNTVKDHATSEAEAFARRAFPNRHLSHHLRSRMRTAKVGKVEAFVRAVCAAIFSPIS